MRKFKVKYAIVKIVKTDLSEYERVDSSYSERVEFESLESAIEYGRKKAEELRFHFEGIEELAR